MPEPTDARDLAYAWRAGYFDDIVDFEAAMLTEHVGELAVIESLNRKNDRKKVGKLSHLNWTRPVQIAWCEQTYAMHDFDHPLYSTLVNVGIRRRELSYRHRPDDRFTRAVKK